MYTDAVLRQTQLLYCAVDWTRELQVIIRLARDWMRELQVIIRLARDWMRELQVIIRLARDWVYSSSKPKKNKNNATIVLHFQSNIGVKFNLYIPQDGSRGQ